MSRRAAMLFTASVLVASGCGASDDPRQTSAAPQKTPGLPGWTAKVDGRLLYFECEGAGAPTVLLEAGLGSDLTVWTGTIPLEVASFTRVCRYDRAGLGQTAVLGNTLGDRTRTAAMQLDDLKGLVDGARLESPLILVGHSWGGGLVRMFAAERRDDVAGVVLLDSYAPRSERDLIAELPRKRPGEDPGITDVRAELRSLGSNATEQLNWNTSVAQIAKANDLGNVPLVVITAGNDRDPALPAPIARHLERVWLRLQRELTGLSTASLHAVATQSTHMIQWDQPDVVVAAIRGLVDAHRTRNKLPTCGELLRGVRNVTCLN